MLLWSLLAATTASAAPASDDAYGVIFAGAPINDIDISVSNVKQCGDAVISWTGTQGPVEVTIGTGGYYVGSTTLDTLSGLQGDSTTWKVNVPAGSDTLIFQVKDSAGDFKYKQGIAVEKSSDSSCLDGGSSSSSASSASPAPSSSESEAPEPSTSSATSTSDTDSASSSTSDSETSPSAAPSSASPTPSTSEKPTPSSESSNPEPVSSSGAAHSSQPIIENTSVPAPAVSQEGPKTQTTIVPAPALVVPGSGSKGSADAAKPSGSPAPVVTEAVSSAVPNAAQPAQPSAPSSSSTTSRSVVLVTSIRTNPSLSPAVQTATVVGDSKGASLSLQDSGASRTMTGVTGVFAAALAALAAAVL